MFNQAPTSQRTVGPFAALATMALAAGVALILVYAGALLAQWRGSMAFVVPLIGSWTAFVSSVLGFTVGVFVWATTYSLWRCAIVGAAPVFVGAVVAIPIGNIGSSSAMNNAIIGAEAAIFMVGVLAPLAARTWRKRDA